MSKSHTNEEQKLKEMLEKVISEAEIYTAGYMDDTLQEAKDLIQMKDKFSDRIHFSIALDIGGQVPDGKKSEAFNHLKDINSWEFEITFSPNELTNELELKTYEVTDIR